jgi:death on curing protein
VARDYLTVADVIGMHHVLIQQYGGEPGVRDPGALEAAALMKSLAINHPVVDGNKRIAFAAADVLLRLNGWRLQRPPIQIRAEIVQIFQSGSFDIAHLDPWLRAFAARAEGGNAGIEGGPAAWWCMWISVPTSRATPAH